MFVKQISVFLENRQGRLAEFTSILSKNSIDLIAISVADTANFGIIRAVVAGDYEKATSVLHENGYTANLTDVLAVGVPDEPGGLAKVLQLLDAENVSIKYLYSLVRRVGDDAVLIFRVDDNEKTAALFAQNGIKMLSHSEISV